MEIEEMNEVNNHIIKRGADNYTMEEREKLKVKVNSDTVLDTEVPENKRWEINIIVHIVEKNL